MTPLQVAFQKWASLAPFKKKVYAQTIEYTRSRLGVEEPRRFTEKEHFDGDCCGFSHYELKDQKLVKKPDSEVCEREQAWREYCRVRDGRSN